MSGLREESQLYDKLSEKYETSIKNGTTLNLYEDCIDIALEGSEREIRFIIFKLMYSDKDVDTGIDSVNKLMKASKVLIKNDYKHAFLISILEAALAEK